MVFICLKFRYAAFTIFLIGSGTSTDPTPCSTNANRLPPDPLSRKHPVSMRRMRSYSGTAARTEKEGDWQHATRTRCCKEQGRTMLAGRRPYDQQ
jgi:hypothetical protein